MIVTFSDSAYIGFLRQMLWSLLYRDPDQAVTVFTLTWSHDQCAMVASEFPTVTFVEWELGEVEWCEDLRTRICCSRPFAIRRLMQNSPESEILMLDADLFIRRPLRSVWPAFCDAAVALPVRCAQDRPVPVQIKYSAGFCFVKGEAGLRFLNDWCDRLCWQRSPVNPTIRQWYWDQITLSHAIERFQGNVTFLDRGFYLSRPPFSPDAVTWSANVPLDEKTKILGEFQRERALIERGKQN